MSLFKLKDSYIDLSKAKELLEKGYKVMYYQDTHNHFCDWNKHLTEEFINDYRLNKNLNFQGKIEKENLDIKEKNKDGTYNKEYYNQNYEFFHYHMNYKNCGLELLELFVLLKKCEINTNFNIFLYKKEFEEYLKFDDYDDKQTPNFKFDQFIYDLANRGAPGHILDVYLNQVEIYFLKN